jgi:hypothetical protein
MLRESDSGRGYGTGTDYENLEANGLVPMDRPVNPTSGRNNINALRGVLEKQDGVDSSSKPGCIQNACICVCAVSLTSGIASASVVIGRAILKESLSFPGSA